MAESNPNVGRTPGSREPNKEHSAQDVDMRKIFMDRLASEREESVEAPPPEQPPVREVRQEQTPGSPPDEGDDGAIDQDGTDVEEESEQVTEYEYVNEDGTTYWGDADGNPFDEPAPELSEEPDSAAEIGALQVDDRQYTVDDIRELVTRNRELDADYRRKTSVMSRLREEYEVNGQEIQAVGSFFSNLALENVKQYENMDTREMTPEQFQAYRQQYDSAKRGADQLTSAMDNLRNQYRNKRSEQLNHAASESVEVLKRIEPRWNNEFYGKLRDFAVESGRFTPEEFANVTDWRSMEGIVALFDRDQVARIGSSDKSETKEPAKRKRRRQRRRQTRNAKGQFAASKDTVLTSSNARKDGTLRDHFMNKLAAERES